MSKSVDDSEDTSEYMNVIGEQMPRRTVSRGGHRGREAEGEKGQALPRGGEGGEGDLRRT